VLLGNMYAIGFIFVILGRSELFTEHTALAVFPVLRGRATVSQLSRLWGLVFAANLLGAALFAVFVVTLGGRLGVIRPEAFDAISRSLVEHDAMTMVLSAIAAGWLMGLLSWLVAAAQETLSRVVVVWIITFGMGLAGLHHCIVGSVEVLAGLFTGLGTTPSEYFRFLLWSTLGNILGGVALVAVLKYSHAVRSR
jgi:formate/nitrite transporter FocA (FNT family)